MIWEDPTCHGATKPVHHNYRGCVLEPGSHSYRAHVIQLLQPVHHRDRALQREAIARRSLHTTAREQPSLATTREKPPAQPKINKHFFKLIFIFGSVSFFLLWVAFLQLQRAGATLVSLRGLLVAAASLVAEHRLQGVQASVVVAHGLGSCGSRALEHRLNNCGAPAQLLHGMWDLPRSGIQLVSPALQSRFLTTGPTGNPLCVQIYKELLRITVLHSEINMML